VADTSPLLGFPNFLWSYSKEKYSPCRVVGNDSTEIADPEFCHGSSGKLDILASTRVIPERVLIEI
jgi:hypothetical protein